MAITESIRVRNCNRITTILYFHLDLMPKSVNLKILGSKLHCKIIT